MTSLLTRTDHRRTRSRRVAIALAVLTTATALTACSGGADRTAAKAPAALTDQAAVANLAKAPARDDPNAVEGGTLKLSMSQDPVCLDGGQVSTAALQVLGRLYYDNLTTLDADGTPQPWLARSWDLSGDGKTYTFHLRKGVTFSDGTAFDAKAVVANFDHWRAPATKSPLAGAYIAPIKSTKVLDANTLQVKLSYPYSAFLNVLAQGWLGLTSPRQLATASNQEICEAPVGTGPFVVDKYTPGESLTLHRRKDYDWSASYLNHKGPAYLDAVDINFVSEASVRYSSLTSGEFDATDAVSPQNAVAVASNPNFVYRNIARQGNPSRLTLNTSRAPFNDVRVRRALSEGIDLDGIVKTLSYGQFGPQHAYLAPTTPYADKGANGRFVHDPQNAAKLLDEAGYSKKDAEGYRVGKDGKRLTAYLPVAQSTSPSPFNDLFQAEAKKLGLDVKIQQVTAAESASRRATGDYDLTTGVWHTNTPDGLYVLYSSNEITSKERIGQNSARLTDKELDTLLLKARQTTDPAQLKKLYKDAELRLEQLVPAIPLYDNYTSWAVNKDVHGVPADSSHGVPLFTLAWKDGGK